MTETTSTKEEILPKHTNGSTERLFHLEVPDNIRGFRRAMARTIEATANQEIDHNIGRTIQGLGANWIAATKVEMSGVRSLDKIKNPRLALALAQLIAGGDEVGGLLALEAPKEDGEK